MALLFAQTVAPDVAPTVPAGSGSVGAFILLTLCLMAAAGAVLWFIRTYEAKLILLGLLAGVFAIGYGAVAEVPQSLALAFMKIAVILVLCGVACSLLSYLGAPGAKENDAPPADSGRAQP